MGPDFPARETIAMSEPVYTSETPATEAPETTPQSGNTEVTTPPAQETSSWDDLFKGEDPAKVRRALDDSRRWEQRAKEHKAAADKLKEIEDRDLSELQRAQRDREEALARVAAIEQEALRYRVASQFGIAREDADEWLVGPDEPSVTRKAQRYLELRGQAAPTSPRPDPGQGPRPTTPEQASDAEYRLFFPND